ncbi:MAG: hypothetical protein R3321_09705, partial [Nitrososphaeraceae archaeon]|nr:hypothetical protein [Nitrososphaeraceae archaeon]
MFPQHIFVKKSPFQEEDEFNYTRENYKAITTAVTSEFFGVTNRIFNENNFSVKYTPEKRSVKEGDKFSFYLEEDYPFNDSIYKDFRKRILKKSITDPNGVITFKPVDPKLIETEKGLEIDQSELIDPAAFYYPSPKRVYFDGLNLIVLTDKKSLVKSGGKDVPEGLVYEYYDEQVIFEIVQIGDLIDNDFEIRLLFRHDLGFLPALPLGSNPEIFKGEIYYPSPIRSVVDPLDMVVIDNSTLLIAKNKTAYPIKIAMEEPCNAEGCDNGMVMDNGDRKKCSVCGG